MKGSLVASIHFFKSSALVLPEVTVRQKEVELPRPILTPSSFMVIPFFSVNVLINCLIVMLQIYNKAHQQQILFFNIPIGPNIKRSQY